MPPYCQERERFSLSTIILYHSLGDMSRLFFKIYKKIQKNE
nr:MAG TPA: hypothetical protein [Caudovirales sp. ctMlE25]